MKIEEKLLRRVISDLGINIRFERGKSIPVKNCWHFSTDGNSVDTIFYDEADFKLAMNRIFVLSKLFHVVILAFCLMDNHIHFLLWGEYDECNRFFHELVRRTSISIAARHTEKHKLRKIRISHQVVNDDSYLKTVICYIIKNPPVAGIPSCSYDYPWSSGSLYFRKTGYWTTPVWQFDNEYSDIRSLSARQMKDAFGHFSSFSQSCCTGIDTGTSDNESGCGYPFDKGIKFLKEYGIVFPGEYVAYEIVESIFKTQKSFLFFMCKTKDSDVESVGSFLSNLTVPDSELRQYRDELCVEMFGETSIRRLDVSQRLRLARALKARYRSSPKQIARLSGLKYEEVSSML